MPRITVHSEFRFSPDGREVVTYCPGEHEVTDQCALYAARRGLAVQVGVLSEEKKTAAQPEIKIAAPEDQPVPLSVEAAKPASGQKASEPRKQPPRKPAAKPKR